MAAGFENRFGEGNPGPFWPLNPVPTSSALLDRMSKHAVQAHGDGFREVDHGLLVQLPLRPPQLRDFCESVLEVFRQE